MIAPMIVRVMSLLMPLLLLAAGGAAGGAAGSAEAAELVMFEAEGCQWCAAWDQRIGPIYAKTEEGRRAPLRRVDLHGPRPADLASVTGVVHTPTFVLIDDGREIGRIRGYPGEDFFWGLLGDLIRRLDP
jgi:hypothetical protein